MMKSVLIPAAIIVVVGTAVGLGFNRFRSGIKVNLSRNYFGVARVASDADSAGASRGAQSVAAEDPGAEAAKTGLTPPHPFQVVSLDEAVELAFSEEAEQGMVVFVDARDDEHYEKGHIPRAFHVHNYNVDQQLPAARPYLEAADTIVVYCGGGECEDSIFLATELESRGFPRSKLRLFEGGMNDWTNAQLPTEEGPDPVQEAGVSEIDYEPAGAPADEAGG